MPAPRQHTHTHRHADDHGSPGFDEHALAEARAPGIARIGIGGPVGSGKTALIEALVPMLLARGYHPLVVTNDLFTEQDAQHVRATLAGVLAPERVVGVETGSCPHTAVRDDPSMNLDAVAELMRRFPDADVHWSNQAATTLTLTFSGALADYFIFVIDVAEGDKIPRKWAPVSPPPICWSSTRSTSPSTCGPTWQSWIATPAPAAVIGPLCSRTASPARGWRRSPPELANGCGVAVRLLGSTSKAVQTARATAWNTARLELLGTAAPTLRKG